MAADEAGRARGAADPVAARVRDTCAGLPEDRVRQRRHPRRRDRRSGLVWANLGDSYERVWTTPFGLRLGDSSVTRELRTWVNSGLMTFFFLVVGLEARREIDLGDLRDRSRFLLPVAAGLFGMVVPVGLYLALNAGGDGGRRLGRRDVDRHRARARPAGDGRARRTGPGARPSC